MWGLPTFFASKNAGAVDADTLRVTQASDSPEVSVLGAVADAAVITSASGSISAKLRGIISLLVSKITVGIDQTTPGTTNAVVSATKPYTNTANQSVAYTGTAGTSAAVNAATTQVIVTLTTDGYIATGSAPTATTGDMFLPAYVPSPPIAVTGGTTKVSAIRDANSGTMKIAEFS